MSLVVAVLAASSSAFAQSRAQTATSLVTITLVAEGTDQSIFLLSFAPKTGSFSMISSDPVQPALSLANTGRGQGAVSQSPMKGLVRSIEFQQTSGELTVLFNTVLPAAVFASPSGERQLLVTVRKLTGREAYAGTRKSRDAGSDSAAAPRTLAAAVAASRSEGFELVMLKYADVSEVVGLLTAGVTIRPNNVFIRREPGFGLPSATGTTYTPPPQEQEELPLGQAVDSNMAIDRRLNAIWIRGTPQYIARIKEQIALIDVPVDSVILETQFVELTETGARNIGTDFANSSGQLAVGTLQAGQFNPFGFGTDPIASAALQAAIYAQVQSGEGRIVSKPRIAAQSGSTAKIITGDALPILTAIALSGVNAVSEQVQYVNVGVTLQIAPRVSEDGFVTSHVYCVVSSVTGFSQGYPTISQREAETSATVRDGETFVIGGLTLESAIKKESKIPLLGDIPLIGDLFSLEQDSDTKTELYIVITPHIVRHRRFEVLDDDAAAALGRPHQEEHVGTAGRSGRAGEPARN
ncbi:MAG: type II secretion system protein GspD [Alphaproteobacteria bacterium]